MHGDFCFSNILFDLGHQIVRVIDPRGRFGQKGIYSDPRYDMAKLRHSIGGLYDFIVADLFDVQEQEGEFVVHYLCQRPAAGYCPALRQVGGCQRLRS